MSGGRVGGGKASGEEGKIERGRRFVVSVGRKNKVGIAVREIDYLVEILGDWYPCSLRLSREK